MKNEEDEIKFYCPYCDSSLHKIVGSDMTYYVCDVCEEMVEPENP